MKRQSPAASPSPAVSGANCPSTEVTGPLRSPLHAPPVSSGEKDLALDLPVIYPRGKIKRQREQHRRAVHVRLPRRLRAELRREGLESRVRRTGSPSPTTGRCVFCRSHPRRETDSQGARPAQEWGWP